MLKKLVSVDGTGVKEFIESDLKGVCESYVFYEDYPKDDQVLIDRLQGADGLLVSWQTPISRQVIEACPDLKYIGMCCSLFDEKSANVDIRAARDHGVYVVGVKDYGDEGVVEFIISSLIQLFKNQGPVKYKDEPIELGDIPLGIIGLGTLGNMVARAGQAFGMVPAYHSRSKKDSPYPYRTLDDLVTTGQVFSSHLPRNTQVFTQDILDKMGPYSVLINTGLSPSYDPQAFLEWIVKDKRFAILDRVSLTPDLIETYKAYPQIIVSDHVTGFTWNARRRLAHKALANIRDYQSQLQSED